MSVEQTGLLCALLSLHAAVLVASIITALTATGSTRAFAAVCAVLQAAGNVFGSVLLAFSFPDDEPPTRPRKRD